MKASPAAALLATTALAAPPAAQAAGTAISIPGKFFDPGRVTIVAGDTVSWLNSDFTEHDVRATDGSFDSAHLQRFGFYTHRFDRVGPVPYLCTIHPFMTGQVDVAGALLHAPAGSVLAGLPLRLDGRAAAGATSVSLERELDEGSWHAVATIVPGPDGAFAFLITPDASSSYRAVTAAGPSAAVTVDVSAAVDVRVTVRPRRRHRLVRVITRPDAPRVLATLQRYSRWHYQWRTLARERLSARGRTSFRLPTGARGRIRVVLNQSRHAPALATSTPVRLRDGKPAADPLDAIVHQSRTAWDEEATAF
jgi:plastocyanin